MLYQQGDVLIKRIEEVDLSKAEKLNHCILAEGEHTGHKHQTDRNKAILYMLTGIMYLKVLERAKILHEEHNPISLPEGLYKVDQVREYDHFLEEARKVED